MNEWMYTNDSEWQAAVEWEERARDENSDKNCDIDNIQHLHVITQHISMRIYALVIA